MTLAEKSLNEANLLVKHILHDYQSLVIEGNETDQSIRVQKQFNGRNYSIYLNRNPEDRVLLSSIGIDINELPQYITYLVNNQREYTPLTLTVTFEDELYQREDSVDGVDEVDFIEEMLFVSGVKCVRIFENVRSSTPRSVIAIEDGKLPEMKLQNCSEVNLPGCPSQVPLLTIRGLHVKKGTTIIEKTRNFKLVRVINRRYLPLTSAGSVTKAKSLTHVRVVPLNTHYPKVPTE